MRSLHLFSPPSTKLASISLAILLAISGALILHNRYPDFLAAYQYVSGQMLADMFGKHLGQPSPEDPLFSRSVADLKRMVMSTDQSARSTAIKALGEANDPSIVPQLIAILNDSNRVDPQKDQSSPTSIAEVSKETLVKLSRNSISREPANLSTLLPFLHTAKHGTVPERIASTEILGKVKDPLAAPLLREIAVHDEEAAVRGNASRALDIIYAKDFDNRLYWELRQRLVEIIIAGCIAICLLLICLINDIRKGFFGTVTWLKIAPLSLLVGLTAIVAIEYGRGVSDGETLARAALRGDLIVLRAINYQDYTDYPADSLAARSLVRVGDSRLILDLCRIAALEPDDLPFFKEMMQKRLEWIVSRIVVSRFDDRQLDQLVRAPDPSGRAMAALVLGKLGVRNQSIEDALATLANDENEEIRRVAREGQSKISSCPVWAN